MRKARNPNDERSTKAEARNPGARGRLSGLGHSVIPSTSASSIEPSFVLRISSGFTLIEVMVSLALALIMMTIFAYIFQISGNFVTRQKGIAENDQSARILTTVLKTDFANRTMRYLAPYHPNMQALPGVNGDTERLGYFYYSENNPLDDTDDVLQFTVQIPTLDSTTQLPTTPLYGHAAFLPATWQANTNYGGANQIT